MAKSWLKVTTQGIDNDAIEFLIQAEIKRTDLKYYRLTKHANFHTFRTGNEETPRWESAIESFIDNFLSIHGIEDRWNYKEYETSMKTHFIRKFRIVIRTFDNTQMPSNMLL